MLVDGQQLVGVTSKGEIRRVDIADGREVLKQKVFKSSGTASGVFVRFKGLLLISWSLTDADRDQSEYTKFQLVRLNDFHIIKSLFVYLGHHREDREWWVRLVESLHKLVLGGNCYVLHCHSFGKLGILLRRGPRLHSIAMFNLGSRVAGFEAIFLDPKRKLLFLSPSSSDYGDRSSKPSVIKLDLNW